MTIGNRVVFCLASNLKSAPAPYQRHPRVQGQRVFYTTAALNHSKQCPQHPAATSCPCSEAGYATQSDFGWTKGKDSPNVDPDVAACNSTHRAKATTRNVLERRDDNAHPGPPVALPRQVQLQGTGFSKSRLRGCCPV